MVGKIKFFTEVLHNILIYECRSSRGKLAWCSLMLMWVSGDRNRTSRQMLGRPRESATETRSFLKSPENNQSNNASATCTLRRRIQAVTVVVVLLLLIAAVLLLFNTDFVTSNVTESSIVTNTNDRSSDDNSSITKRHIRCDWKQEILKKDYSNARDESNKWDDKKERLERVKTRSDSLSRKWEMSYVRVQGDSVKAKHER